MNATDIAAAVTFFDTITGDVTAGASADLSAVQGIANLTVANLDVSVSAFGALPGAVQAGRDVHIFTSESFSGTATSGRNTDGLVGTLSGP